jgi:hypothetical protein
MTTPTPHPPGAGSGDGPVSLGEEVQVDQAWLPTHSPALDPARQQAQTAEQRAQLTTQIEQAATTHHRGSDADAGQREGDDPSREFVNVRIQWAETTRYQGDFYLDPYSTDDQLWSEIAMVSEAERRTLDVDDVDNTILSVVDLDGDGTPSVLERAIATTTVTPESEPTPDPTQARDHDPKRWVELADSIDPALSRGSDWPRLAAALDRAAASDYDVVAKLPALAATDELPERHPARELHYRLLSDCDGALPTAPHRTVPVDSNPSPHPTPAPAPGPAHGPAGPSR